MIAIDTNVFVYSFDSADPDKQRKARAFLLQVFHADEAAVIPWQVAAELLARLRRWEALGVIEGSNVRARFDDFLNVWSLAFPTHTVFQRSFALHDRYSLSHWDSMLVAACQEAGVTRLYSEDMQHGADYDGVKIVNPFI
jgi:predicted nucleic acid-binding protein